MKNKKLLLQVLLGSCICFLAMVGLSLLFQKWNIFDYQTQSFQSILFGAIFSSIGFFIFMHFFSKKRLKKMQKENK